jgi:hypothetical protein
MNNNLGNMSHCQQLAELRAGEMLLALVKKKKRTLIKSEKQEVLDILVESGVTECMLNLVCVAMDALITPKTGRKPDLFKRDLIRNYFVMRGSMPVIRDNKTGTRNKNDAQNKVVSECAKELKKQLEDISKRVEAKEDKPALIENDRSLITNLLKDTEFRKEVEELIKLKSKMRDSIPDMFNYYSSLQPRKQPPYGNDIN